MKMNRIVFSMVIALVAIMAVTGCKKGQPKLTPLPGGQTTNIQDDRDRHTLTRGQEIDNQPEVSKQTGPIATAEGWDLANYNQDRSALAAYTVHFKFDSAVIMKDDHSKLEAVASALKSSPSDKLLIEGNCDERGTEEYNRALGERRALAAREALAKMGVNPDHIRTISYGKDKPVNPSHDESAWKANRRADFILLHPKSGTM